jgi:hypothetical protein
MIRAFWADAGDQSGVMMSATFAFLPFLVFLLWLGVIVYVLLLLTRLVNAVEQIARSLPQRLPDRPPS